MSKFNLRGVNHELLLKYLAKAIHKLPFPSIFPIGKDAIRLEFPKKGDDSYITEEELKPYLTGKSGPCYETMVS